MYSPKIVTTSWDDGDPNDIRIAELLSSKGLPATFYIPMVGYREGKRIEDCELRAMSSEGFEIGGHTISHRSLPRLSPKELDCDVRVCKQMLEQIMGREVPVFCYPNGRYNAGVIRCVKNAGYRGARTTRMLSLTTQFRPFEMPTSLQAYPHSRSAYVKNQGRAKSISGLVRYSAELKQFKRWVDLGKHLFNQVLENGGIWHLYGHSWEINALGLWDDLYEIVDYISHRADVIYATNGQLLSELPATTFDKTLR